MNVNEYSPLALAFIGDAHYNLMVKRFAASKEVKMDKMQKLATTYVSAKGQAGFIKNLLEKEFLTAEEIAIYKRGRNAKSHNAPKNTDIVTYKMSTGFEALWGYLYLKNDFKRLVEIGKEIGICTGEENETVGLW